MFSQVCVKNILSKGEVVSAPLHAGIHTPRTDTPSGQTTPTPDTATAADGTHPTGMHSCYEKNFNIIHTLSNTMVLEGRQHNDSASEQSVSHVLMPSEIN